MYFTSFVAFDSSNLGPQIVFMRRLLKVAESGLPISKAIRYPSKYGSTFLTDTKKMPNRPLTETKPPSVEARSIGVYAPPESIRSSNKDCCNRAIAKFASKAVVYHPVQDDVKTHAGDQEIVRQMKVCWEEKRAQLIHR